MSPEQARGEDVDERTDIWAFGCVLYELLAGKRPFNGENVSGIITSVLESEPDWHGLPSKTPARVRELLQKCLQKDAKRRPANIGEALRVIQKMQHRESWRWLAPIGAAVLVALAVGATIWVRSPSRRVDRAEWIQLTKFADPVSQPALSHDGRMLTFVRSTSTFFAAGQIYLKSLPDGEPVQLTHDDLKKMDPAFSLDQQHIAYTTVDTEFHWDTWLVPVEGGEPRRWLKNVADLIWTAPGRILFAEMRNNPVLGVVSATEDRVVHRDIYFPSNGRARVQRPQL